MKIKELYVYPIKSLGGISLKEAKLSDTGIQFDRYWMLVDEEGKFITQREFPQLALFQLQLFEKSIVVTFNKDVIEIPIHVENLKTLQCEIWKDNVLGLKQSDVINNWFSEKLESKVFLVRKDETDNRNIRNDENTFVNFSDGDQYLIIGEESVNYLNEKLESKVEIDRFRPNIVFEKGEPHIEDFWDTIQIGDSNFQTTRLCSRCKIITINQQTGIFDEDLEPLKTLGVYRLKNRKIMFGQYLKLINSKNNSIKVGDELKVISNQN